MTAVPAAPDTPIPATLLGLARVLGGLLGGVMVQYGVMTGDNLPTFIGWVTAGASGAWAIYAYYKAHQKLAAAVAAPAQPKPAPGV
jgi:hypothetical protein